MVYKRTYEEFLLSIKKDPLRQVKFNHLIYLYRIRMDLYAFLSKDEEILNKDFDKVFEKCTDKIANAKNKKELSKIIKLGAKE